MPSHTRVYSKDEELGKRDDDFKAKKIWSPASMVPPWRWRKRRVLTVLAVIILVFLFIRNLPPDLGPINERLSVPLRSPRGPPGDNIEPTGPPPRPHMQRDAGEGRHYYDGAIKFYRLAMSLHGITRTMGSKPQNRNVLFAVSSLKSASNLMPMACEMAKVNRNFVHMTFMGRDTLPLDDILEINGVTKPDCDVYFHDGRPDYSEFSTDRRAEISVAGAMKHVNDFMHPQAIIMDDSAVEDAYFTRAMRGRASEMNLPLIEIPSRQYEEYMWITKLDSTSLANWFKPSIDILIHALPDSSGGLMRVLESLKDAEYDGLRIPKLTIEVPSDIDPFARRYLTDMKWPPRQDESPLKTNSLTLRHRVTSSRTSSEQAWVRFLESFYPADVANNHVLVLSPQAELSPLYLQYLHYTILEYHYSGAPGSQDVLGITLDIPSTFLNGSGEFIVPTLPNMNADKYHERSSYDQTLTPPFLNQAPSSTASLIFGDKWTTMHSFLSRRLESTHTGKADKPKKLVSETEPAWMEYLLELMVARGWSMLHPPFALATKHNELAQIPEEYMKPKTAAHKGDAKSKATEHPEEEAFLVADGPSAMVEHPERNTDATQPLHEVIPMDGHLPELAHLPYMAFYGNLITPSAAAGLKDHYAPIFRRTIGGCDAKEADRDRLVRGLEADDLFCLPGMVLEYEDEAAKKEAEVAAAAAAAQEEEEEEEEAKDKPDVLPDDGDKNPEEPKTDESGARRNVPNGIGGRKGVETKAEVEAEKKEAKAARP